MSSIVEQLQKTYKEHFVKLGALVKRELSGNAPFTGKVLDYIISKKGKKIRPLLLFLFADIVESVTKKSYVGAFVIETIHNASIVHDDVVDASSERRGMSSVNEIWNNKVSVLSGDFLLAKSLVVACKYDQYGIIDYISDSLMQMSEGELIQLERSKKVAYDEKGYLEVITKKTAVLLASACACGALSADESKKKMIDVAWNFGFFFGIAFQMKDDLLDFSPFEETGKKQGNDLLEKKITLPLIEYSKKCSPQEWKKMQTLLTKYSEKDEKSFLTIHSLIQEKGGFEYTKKMIHSYSEKALATLGVFPESTPKTFFKRVD